MQQLKSNVKIPEKKHKLAKFPQEEIQNSKALLKRSYLI